MAAITEVSATRFRTISHMQSDSEGHGHPGPATPTTLTLLTIRDDEGDVGYHVTNPQYLTPEQMDAFVRPVLLGRDPLQREALWRGLWHRQRNGYGRLPDRTISAAEQALWDLTGRKLGLPVWKLLGGDRDRVPAYASIMCGDEEPGGLSTPEEYGAFAEQLVAQGYKAVKLHTWMTPVSFAPSVEMDIRACAAVREAVGPDIALMLDPHHYYSRIEALELGRGVEKLGFAWMEEPMNEYSMGSYRWLCDQLDLPICGPESVAGGPQSRADWITAGACDILRIGVDSGPGIGPTLKAFHLAEAHGMDCELHGGGAGALAVLSVVHNTRWYERGLLHPHYDYDQPPPHLNAIVDPVENGDVLLSHRPGLGVDLNLDYIEENRVPEPASR